MSEEIKKTDSVEVMISTQLEKFEVKEEELQALVTKYSELVVNGVSDKAGRKAVSEARKHLKTKRAGITNIGKELRDIPNKLSKAIIKREKEFIDIISPEEDRLAQIESDIAEEEEEIRKQKEFEEQERILARTRELDSYGATFNGVQYELGDNLITLAEVRLFTDIEFTRKMEFFKEWQQQEAQLKLEAEITRQVSLTNNKEQAILHIQSLGYIYDKDSFYNAEFRHRFVTIRDLETEEDLRVFKMEMDNIANHFKEAKEKAEAQRIADEALKAEQDRLALIAAQQKAQQDELDRKQKELDDQLKAIQAQKEADEKRAKQLEYDAKVNLFESRRSQLMNTPNLIHKDVFDSMNSGFYSLSEEAWTLFLFDCKSDFDKEQDRLEIEAEEAAAAEEKRRIEMAPDVELLRAMINELSLSMKNSPTMKTPKGKAVLNNINELKSKMIKYIEEQIKNL